jgi:circadian clock protein KaiC
MALFSIEKLTTGISGFDEIAYGGLPKGRTTLVSGTSGSAKTVFACQLLAEGIRQSNEAGVFVTFEESADNIRSNMSGFGWDIAEWERAGKWRFVDASSRPDEEYVFSGYDLGALMARIQNSVRSIGAKRVALDSIGVMLAQFNDSGVVRHELFRIIAALKTMDVTAVVTAERTSEGVGPTHYGVEEFVSDNVIILNNRLEDERRRRTIEILKFRGTMHAKGEYPFTIIPNKGIVVIPVSALELMGGGSNIRVTMGNVELDTMSDGGAYRASTTIVAGTTGTGKTLLATTFTAGGAASGERCLYFSFEESREQLIRNAAGWGMDLEAMEQAGLVRIMCIHPESAGLQDHLIHLQDVIEDYHPNRVVVDSLSAMERVSSARTLSEFMMGLTASFRQMEITSLFTNSTSGLIGNRSITEGDISTITDSIILLRYLESNSEVRRGLMILKMRGSNHDKRIRELTIDDKGITIGKAFRNVSGILSGNVAYMTAGESSFVKERFESNSDSLSQSSSGGD